MTMNFVDPSDQSEFTEALREERHALLHRRIRHDFTNHPPINDDVNATFDEATRRFIDLAEWLVDNVPAGRELSLALTELEKTSMWTKAGIARHQNRMGAPPEASESAPAVAPAAAELSVAQRQTLMLLGVGPNTELPDVSDVSTMNAQGVGTNGETISVMAPTQMMSRDQALVHAAWLALLADDSRGRFAAILNACANT